MERLTIPHTLAEWNERGREYLPGHLGIEFLLVEPDEVRARMRVEREKCAWNGYLHAWRELKGGKIEVPIDFDNGMTPGIKGKLRFIVSEWNS